MIINYMIIDSNLPNAFDSCYPVTYFIILQSNMYLTLTVYLPTSTKVENSLRASLSEPRSK